jgi:hypothetical protein
MSKTKSHLMDKIEDRATDKVREFKVVNEREPTRDEYDSMWEKAQDEVFDECLARAE